MAAWAAYRKFGNRAEYIATFHEDPPPKLHGKDIYTLDMTFPRDVTERLARDNRRVTSVDHHVTTKDITLMTEAPSYALNHSGAVLAWRYFHPGTAVPKLLLTVEDMDLWRHKLPHTRELFAYWDLFDFSFPTWSRLVTHFEQPAKRAAMVQSGALLIEYQNRLVERRMSKSLQAVVLDGRTVYAVNDGTASYRSYLGHRLAQESPSGIGLLWHHTSSGEVAVSLRSVGSADVGRLAARHGGGGHKHASGFRVPSLAKIPWKLKKKPSRP